MSLFDVSKSDDHRAAPVLNGNDKQSQRMAHGTTQIHNAGESDATDAGRLSLDERKIVATNGDDGVSLGFQDDGTYRLVFTDDDVDIISLGKDANGFSGMLFNNGSADIMFVGKDSGGSYIVKIAQSGADVKTASNSQLVFNSAQNMFKIVQTASTSTTLTNVANTVAAGTQTQTIAHNLGFKPAFVVYLETPSTYIGGNVLLQLPEEYVLPAGHALGGGTIFSQFKARVDTTNLYIDYFHRVGTDYSPSLPTFTVRYYLLQETAST